MKQNMTRKTIIDICPICGVGTDYQISSYSPHNCNPKTLAGIDAAGRSEGAVGHREPSEGERLRRGFELIDEEDDGDGPEVKEMARKW